MAKSSVKLSGAVNGLKAGYKGIEVKVKVKITKPWIFFAWIGALIKVNFRIVYLAFKSIN